MKPDYSATPWLELSGGRPRVHHRLDRDGARVAVSERRHGTEWVLLGVARLSKRGRLRHRSFGRTLRRMLEEMIELANTSPKATARRERAARRDALVLADS